MPTKKQTISHLKPNEYEKAAWKLKKLVCGIDEVGRGCLAGPLVTAAVILYANKKNSLIRDSKLMSPLQLQKAAQWIKENSWYGYGIVDNRIIDQRNIWQATLIAMQKSVVNLLASCPEQPMAILVDAMPLTLEETAYHAIPIHHFPKGETLSTSIAAASILAKVKRDEIMRQFDAIFPGYAFAEHKGYGTQKHQDALKALQPCLIHRHSFLKKFHSRITPSVDLQSAIWSQKVFHE